MNPDLNTLLNAALKLPPEQKLELICKLSESSRPRKPGAVRKHFGAFDSGDPNSADNEKIDADLAKSYLDMHEFEN